MKGDQVEINIKADNQLLMYLINVFLPVLIVNFQFSMNSVCSNMCIFIFFNL